MKSCCNLSCGALAVALITSIALLGCTPVERPVAGVTAPPSVTTIPSSVTTIPPSVTVADPAWLPDLPDSEEWWAPVESPDVPESASEEWWAPVESPDVPESESESEEWWAPVAPEGDEPDETAEPDAMAELDELAESAAVETPVPWQPPVGFGKLVEIDLELPAPAFRGTPVPLDEPNVEQPLGSPRPAFLAPEGTVNLALGRQVSASDPAPVAGELDYITNGDKEASDFGYLELGPGTQWVQIDLGRRATIFAVLLWHYHAEARVYRDVVVQVSDCPDFLDAATAFNNDYNNTSGLGVGPDLGYVETSEGKLIDARGLEGRYVRLHSRGNHLDDGNHYTEVAVYGTPLEASD